MVLDCCTPPAPNATPFDQPIPPKSDNNVPSPTKWEEDAFYAGLQRASPTAVALSLHAKHSDSFMPKCVSGTAPMPLDQLYDPNVSCESDMMLHCATVDITVTEEQVQYLVQQTVDQSKSKLWFSMRADRVTASTFYAACHTRTEKPALSVLRSICMPNAHRFSSAATDWGKTHESVARDQYEALHAVQHTDSVYQASGLFLSNKYLVARDQYEALHAMQHTDSVCQASGLFLSKKYLVARDQYEALHAVQHTDAVYQASGLFLSNKYLVARDQYEALHAVQHTDSVCQASGLFLSIEYPMLDASPDGLVQCMCCGEGLVEIKCPYTLRESSDFGQLAWMCLVDDIYCLSWSHRHYVSLQVITVCVGVSMFH